MLEYAKRLLRLQFDQCMMIVEKDAFYKRYALEKWRHSWQVAGAGNYLVKRIEWLQERSSAYVEMVKTAILLHDVCRFTEITQRYQHKDPVDHSVSGAVLLSQTPLFQDIRIWLPIKHHGHVIERLYADEEYQNIADDQLKKEIELICFIVRDADKIANFNLLLTDPEILPLFLGKSEYIPEKDGVISEKMKDRTIWKETLPRSYDCTMGERMAGFVSWFLDINYQSAIDYCSRLNLPNRLFDMFSAYCSDEEFKTQYLAFVRQYLQTHKFLP